MITAPLRQELQSRRSKVRSRIKTLLSTHTPAALACLTRLSLPGPVDARLPLVRSSFASACGVGGFCVHAPSVISYTFFETATDRNT